MEPVDFSDVERAHDDALADEAGTRTCVWCDDEIPQGRADLGATSCGECKPLATAA